MCFFSAEVKAAFNAPDAPKTVLEALEQRLEKYKATASEAQTAGDSAKARRMQRIVKQYQDAVKDFKAKRPVDFEDLPTPPGFGPIPTGTFGLRKNYFENVFCQTLLTNIILKFGRNPSTGIIFHCKYFFLQNKKTNLQII